MRQTSRAGFTLIELLVVIAIVAILAGITFGGITSAIRTARRNVAASEATSVAMAISLFYKDYGWLPLPPGSQGGADPAAPAVNRQVIRTLLAVAGTENENPKGKVYLDLETTGNTGELLDPWGNEYRMLLDLNFDGKIEYNSVTYNTKAIVVSSGRDETAGTDNDVASVRPPEE